MVAIEKIKQEVGHQTGHLTKDESWKENHRHITIFNYIRGT